MEWQPLQPQRKQLQETAGRVGVEGWGWKLSVREGEALSLGGGAQGEALGCTWAEPHTHPKSSMGGFS